LTGPVVIPFAKRTVFTSSGVGDLGRVDVKIAEIIAKPSGAIRLLNGVEGAKTGFGRIHIESHEKRVKQINGMGFKDVVSYIYHVASAYERIALQENDRLLFLREGQGLQHQVICQWDDEIGIWSVTTAFPKGAVRGLQILWEKQ
jgi:hypothetical protein